MAATLYLLLFVFLVGVESSVDGQLRLYNHLQKIAPKVSHVVPKPKMVVNVSITIYDIFGLSSNEVMEMNGWIRFTWLDQRLSWKPSDYDGAETCVIDASKIWRPDIGIANSKQAETKDFAHAEFRKAVIDSSGIVRVIAYFLSETPCPIRTELFPFDNQTCPVIFSSSYSTTNDFYIKVTDMFAPNLGMDTVGQWRLTLYDTKNEYENAGMGRGDEFQTVRLTMSLRRKPMYHIVLVIIPYCLISVLGAVLFAIKEPNDRFGVSLTILLAMAVYVMIVSQEAPLSMETLSVLDSFLLVQMSLVVGLTFIVVLGPMVCKKRSSGSEEEDAMIGGRRRNLKTWRRTIDLVFLGIYLVASIFNGIVYLYVIPKTRRSRH